MSTILLLSCPWGSAIPTFGYRIVATYPHATDSYTEGCFYIDGIFYESIGINGRSAVLAVAVETGRTLRRHDLPSQYFAEGIVDWGSNLYQWTCNGIAYGTKNGGLFVTGKRWPAVFEIKVISK